MSKKIYEVEIRGLLTKDAFERIVEDLTALSEKREEDHRETFFFMIPNATLKVAKLLSKETAKIAYKSGDIVQSIAQRELEFDIPFKSYEDAIDMFKAIGLNNHQETRQTRYNFLYRGIDISIKWSKDWGYHFEAEILVDDEAAIERTHATLSKQCEALGLIAMSETEFEDFRKRIDASYVRT